MNVLSIGIVANKYRIIIGQGGMKMAELITPEMITIAIASLAVLTFLMLLITIASLSRVKKRLLIMGAKSFNLEDKQRLLNAVDKVASFESRLDRFDSIIEENQNQLNRYELKLNDHAGMFAKIGQMMSKNMADITEAASKITSLESRSDMLENVIVKRQNQFTKYESKINEHDILLGQVSQMLGKNASNFTKGIQRIDTLEEKFQNLEEFQIAVEKARSLIIEAFSTTQIKKLNEDTVISKRKNLHDEIRVPSGEKQLGTEDFDIFSMHRDLKLNNP